MSFEHIGRTAPRAVDQAAAKQSGDPKDLHRSIDAARTLRTHIAGLIAGDGVGDPSGLLGDDLIALQDTFDGETSLDDELRAAVLAEDEDRIMVDGIKAREAELAERRRRIERRMELRRGLIEQAMAIAGWAKKQFDIATLSLGKAAPRVEIDSESNIPSQFFKPPKPAEPELDKAGLKAVLIERHRAIEEATKIDDEPVRAARLKAIDDIHPAIPGCHLETGGVSLMVRRK